MLHRVMYVLTKWFDSIPLVHQDPTNFWFWGSYSWSDFPGGRTRFGPWFFGNSFSLLLWLPVRILGTIHEVLVKISLIFGSLFLLFAELVALSSSCSSCAVPRRSSHSLQIGSVGHHRLRPEQISTAACLPFGRLLVEPEPRLSRLGRSSFLLCVLISSRASFVLCVRWCVDCSPGKALLNLLLCSV